MFVVFLSSSQRSMRRKPLPSGGVSPDLRAGILYAFAKDVSRRIFNFSRLFGSYLFPMPATSLFLKRLAMVILHIVRWLATVFSRFSHFLLQLALSRPDPPLLLSI